MAVFWVVAPCSLVEVYRRFRGTCCLHHHRPDDGSSKYLWNVGKLLPGYTTLQPKRQASSTMSYGPPWEPHVLNTIVIHRSPNDASRDEATKGCTGTLENPRQQICSTDLLFRKASTIAGSHQKNPKPCVVAWLTTTRGRMNLQKLLS
jgi:hypothetical protein